MPSAREPSDLLRLSPERSLLCAGETLRGFVELHLPAPARVEQLTLEASGRELIKAIGRYAPAVYRFPVPRPFGRTRSGTVDVGYTVATEPGGAPFDLDAGEHLLPFELTLPADCLPTYGGAAVVVEHELLATVRLRPGGLVRQWVPLHVWRREPEPDDHRRPLVLTLTGPIHGTVALGAHALALGRPLELDCHLEHDAHQPWRTLVVELHALETTRHLAATDVSEYLAARCELRLPPGPRLDRRVSWTLPHTLAPTMVGQRFTLGWRLEVAVTRPWRLGARASAPVRLFDPA